MSVAEVQRCRGAALQRGRVAAVLLAGTVALAVFADPAGAQSDSTAAAQPPAGRVQADSTPASPVPGPWALGWGKWAAAALAAGFTTLGIEHHNDGNAAYRSLITYCGQTAICTIAPDGRYADPTAEATYQRVVRRDRAARAWLVAGQLTALGSAVLFVMDLMRQREPPNIPYSGLLVESEGGVTRVGVRIPFRM